MVILTKEQVWSRWYWLIPWTIAESYCYLYNDRDYHCRIIDERNAEINRLENALAVAVSHATGLEALLHLERAKAQATNSTLVGFEIALTKLKHQIESILKNSRISELPPEEKSCGT